MPRTIITPQAVIEQGYSARVVTPIFLKALSMERFITINAPFEKLAAITTEIREKLENMSLNQRRTGSLCLDAEFETGF